MIKIIELALTPQEAQSEAYIKPMAGNSLAIEATRISQIKILRKSIDARKKDIKVNLKLEVVYDQAPNPETKYLFNYKDVNNAKEVIIVGAGPSGLFAALELIELGIKPIIFERGKNASDRKRDIAMLNRQSKLNPESNYCFGEGGAGTFSDGKLYTRAQKRGDITKVLEILHANGANENILYEMHPHIGTDKLPTIIANIRQIILNCGGQIFFETKVVDLLIEYNKINGVVTKNGDKHLAQAVILATGHSARDIYELLYSKNIKIEAKPFAMGVRVEHPQELINEIQYHRSDQMNFLPPAEYSLTEQINGRGVYSFCMCPGGYIVAAATQENQVVVNGMSPSERNSPYANAGIVMEIRTEDIPELDNYKELAGLIFQEKMENMAKNNGGYKQSAPAQRLVDFVNGKLSNSLPYTSYFPGITSSPLHFWLPENISNALREAFKLFDNKMRGFLTNQAIIVGVESRTSSPIRIPRDVLTMQHVQIQGLFPCGEGAGYAGGIMSSAIDGINCANKIAQKM